MTKFLRAIQLDVSDRMIYDSPAVPGEWVVPGSFTLWDIDPQRLSPKQRQVFEHAMLGTESLGWTTLAIVDTINLPEIEQVIQRLAQHLWINYGAPDLTEARRVAEEEVAFAMSLCDHPVDTVIAIQRHMTDEGVEETFRVVQTPHDIDHSRVKIWGVEA